MKSLYGNKNTSLRKMIVIIGIFSVLAIIFLCPPVETILSLKGSHAMLTMNGDNNAPINHTSHFIELTSFTAKNTSLSSVVYLFSLIIFIALFSLRGKLHLHFPALLSASNFFIRKRLNILHIARQSFYSWYSLFGRAPNTIMAT